MSTIHMSFARVKFVKKLTIRLYICVYDYINSSLPDTSKNTRPVKICQLILQIKIPHLGVLWHHVWPIGLSKPHKIRSKRRFFSIRDKRGKSISRYFPYNSTIPPFSDHFTRKHSVKNNRNECQYGCQQIACCYAYTLWKRKFVVFLLSADFACASAFVHRIRSFS